MLKFHEYVNLREEELLSEISGKQLAGLSLGAGLGLMGGKVTAGEVLAKDPETGKWTYVDASNTEERGGVKYVKGDKQIFARNAATGKWQYEDESKTELRGGIRYVKSSTPTEDPLTKFADKGSGELEDSGLEFMKGIKADIALKEKEKKELKEKERKLKDASADEEMAKAYRKNEILLKKHIIPLKYIRDAQENKEKFDIDYKNLKSPIGKIGMDTYKDEFEKPVIMYIVTDAGMDRYMPDASAYARLGEFIVMRKSAFSKLPTATEDGEMTLDGSHSLAHELRHMTQIGDVPDEESFHGRAQTIFTYMRDPREMGVRLAALKNHIAKESMRKLTDAWLNKTKNLKDNLIREAIGEALVNVFEENANGVEMFLDPSIWAKKAFDALTTEQKEKMLESYNSEDKALRGIYGAINQITAPLDKNSDIESIKLFYRVLPVDVQKDYMQKLKQHYDTVVKAKQDDQDLRGRLAQRLSKLKGQIRAR